MKRKLKTDEVQNLLLNVMIDFDKYCRDNDLHYYLIGGSLLGAVRHKGFIPWDDDMDVGMIRSDYMAFINLIKTKQMPYEMKNYRNDAFCDYVITRLYINGTEIDNPIIKYTKLEKRLYFDIFPLDFIPDDLKAQKEQEKKILLRKRLLSYVDYRDFQNGVLTKLIKKTLSLVLSRFRNKIIASLENEMMKVEKSNRLCSLASQYSYQKQNFAYSVYGNPIEYEFCGYKFFGPADYNSYLKQLYGKDYMDLPPIEKRRKGWDIYECEKNAKNTSGESER